MENIELDFRKRFVSDYNLPIQILISPYFEERLLISEELFKGKTKYDKIMKFLHDNNMSFNDYLSSFYQKRDKIITDILENEEYKKFLTMDMNQFRLSRQYPTSNLFIEPNAKRTLIHIDLKKANFQALKFISPDIVKNASTYEDFIDMYDSTSLMKESKYNRQVIFGKLNPKRQITVERFLLEKVYEIIIKNDFFANLCDLIHFGNDEIAFLVDDNKINENVNLLLDNCVKEVEKANLFVRINAYKLQPFKFISDNQTLTIFLLKNIFNHEDVKLKCCPIIYFPQVWKLISHEEINENDRTFIYEGRLATFKHNLTLI